MREDFFRIWVFLADSPLLWLTATLCSYLLAISLYRRFNSSPLLLPVLIGTLLVVSLLLVTNTPYETYFEGAQFIHFLIGPATVALAIPLYNQLPRLKLLWKPLSLALIIGTCVGLVSSVTLTWLLGGSPEMIISMAPKSATMPIAMALSDYFGGQPSLAAVSVALTGISGSMMASPLLWLLRINDPVVRGVSMGVAAHAIGTARMIQIDETMGAFAALAMGVTGILTAIFMPVIIQTLLALGWIY